MTPEKPELCRVHTAIPKSALVELDELVASDSEWFVNRSEFIRAAIDEKLSKHRRQKYAKSER